MERTDILIIGAGPTGLGAAWRLDALGHRQWLLCEAAAHAGGLASSVVDDHGFTWDLGGHVQFSHYDYFDELMDDLLGADGWHYHDRESWVWVRQRWVPYPFQLNVHRLPEDDAIAAVAGMVHAVRTASDRPRNFGEWIEQAFGPGIAALFMRPYNTKVWAREPEQMAWDWIGDRVAVADLPRIVRNLRASRDDVSWGPNNRFRFPRRGGTGVIWQTLHHRLAARHRGRIRLGARLATLDTANRVATFASGEAIGYERLLSTMPLDRLIAISDLAPSLGSATCGLEFNSTHVIGVGLHGGPSPTLATKCWMYFPEGDCPFYRVTHFSHYASANVPAPERQWSLMAEVAESAHRPVHGARVVSDTVDGMIATGLIADRAQVHHTWHRRLEHGYPVPSLHRDRALDVLLPELERRQVWSRGRFGAWKYEVSNQDHSFAQGVEAVDHWLTGDAEETLRAPERVNSRRPQPRTAAARHA
jgi:protoporphyrinogen oxidase